MPMLRPRMQVLDVEIKRNGVDDGMGDVRWKLRYGACLFSGVVDSRNGIRRVLDGHWEDINSKVTDLKALALMMQ